VPKYLKYPYLKYPMIQGEKDENFANKNRVQGLRFRVRV
jgi:hypothetical protein